MIPRGLTYRTVAHLFQVGFSMQELALRFRCEDEDIQEAIRCVLERQEQPKRTIR